MASLRSIGRVVSALRIISLGHHARKVHTGRPLAAYWNKDWAPGPYPKTQEEREAAAKKYGLRIEDYEPYPDDGTGLGDYPKLPEISMEGKDAYENWDIPALKRNFGEPVHADANWLRDDRMSPDVVATMRIPIWQQFLMFMGVMGGTALLAYLVSPIKLHMAVMPKQYPFNELCVEKGLNDEGKPIIHYTFEPAD